MHVFLIKTANSLMPSHLGSPTKFSGELIQIPCQEGTSSKLRTEHWCIRFSIGYTLNDFVGHLMFENLARDRNIDQTTRGQTLWRSIYSWRLTSLLVVTLLKMTIKPLAFSYTCKSYTFLSRHLYSYLVVEIQTLHGYIASNWAGQVLGPHFSADQTCTWQLWINSYHMQRCRYIK